MGTPYKTIWDSFVHKIEDVNLPYMSAEDQARECIGWMNEALIHIEMDCIVIDSDLNERDDISLEFEEDLSYSDCEIISMYMVGAYYSRIVNSLEHTSLFVGTSGEKWESQKGHLEAMRSMRDYWLEEGKRLARNKHTLINSYLEGDL